MPEQPAGELSVPIQTLQFSKKFKDFAAANQHHTLQSLLQLRASEIMKLPDADYHLVQELISYLESKGLASNLKE